MHRSKIRRFQLATPNHAVAHLLLFALAPLLSFGWLIIRVILKTSLQFLKLANSVTGNAITVLHLCDHRRRTRMDRDLSGRIHP